SPRSTLSLLAKLQKRGVDLAGITLLMHTPPFDNQRKRGRFNALAYLQSQGECLPLSNGVYIQLKDGSLQPDLLMLT
ncbi:MAG: hypothetical protein KGQ49_07315, partial [Verrucomicrobia bacterium]|nr:hypothetical protein [Verrucomicrobiota bacterium]